MRAGLARSQDRVPALGGNKARGRRLLHWAAAVLLAAVAPSAVQADVKPLPGGPLDDAVEPLQPRTPADAIERDRAEAEALFGAGRIAERRQDYAAALRKYQRAIRRDPGATGVLVSLLQVALRAGRTAEADRYGRKLADVPGGDVFLLSRIAMRLAEQGHWEAAAKIYEKVLAAPGGEKPAVTDFVIRLELAKLYHLLDQDDKSAEHFARVLEAMKHPEQSGLDDRLRKELLNDPAPIYRLAGECFLGANRVDAAKESFAKAHEAKPDKRLYAFDMARAELAAKRPGEAIKQLQVYFDERAHVEGVEPYELLDKALKASGKSGELAERLERILAADPGNVALTYFLADHYRQAGKLDKAEKLYAGAIKKSPTLAGYRGLIDIARRAKRLEDLLGVLGDVAEKLSGLEPLGEEAQAVTADPALVGGLIDLARARHQADPRQPEYPQLLAVALLALDAKRFADAGEMFDLAIAARPSQAAELLLQWGIALLAADKPLEAAKVFQRAVELKTKPEIRAGFYYYWITALGAADRFDEALATARKAAEWKKDSARLAGRVGWALFLMKRYDEAGKQYRALLDRFDRQHDSQEVRLALREARLLLSNIANLQNRPAEAEEWLEQVLDEFPDDPAAANDLGYLWAERGAHLERALRLVQLAIADEPENQAYRDSLGWVYYQRGQYSEAVAELEKAAAGKKPDGVIFDHLGDALLKAGQPDKARESWRKAVAQFRKDNEEEKAQAVEKKLKADN